MKTSLLFFAALLVIFSSCSKDKYEIAREKKEKFELTKAGYQFAIDKQNVWENLSSSYTLQMPPWGVPENDCAKVMAVFNRYDKQSNNCRKGAREFFILLCERATSQEDFQWIYGNKSVNLRESDLEINKKFMRKVVDRIFSNEYFSPDSNWVEVRKSVMGREFYTQK